MNPSTPPHPSDTASCSPWIQQLPPDRGPQRLEADTAADVAVVGAGIAGVATSFFTLRGTSKTVLLLERNQAGHGASGHNAGQLATYFERPLCELVEEYGFAEALAAQKAFDDSHDLLDLMVAESGADVRVDRFQGKMGMFTLNHLEVHLRNNLLRLQGGLQFEACVVSEEAEFLAQIPAEFTPLYTVVPQSQICALLDSPTDRYRAVLFSWKGCANSALLTQQVLAYLQRHYPERFRYVDRTPVDRIVLHAGNATLEAGAHRVTAGRVVLCTNGFTDHVVVDSQGAPLGSADTRWVKGNIGYMAAFVETEQRKPDALSFIRNKEIGGAVPYVYVTRRPHQLADRLATLTCMGGPERPLAASEQYDPSTPFPSQMLAEMDSQIRPLAQPERPPGVPYDYTWHGLMGYTLGSIRRIGEEPCNPVLLYNLGCNGVGFLPSVCGGERVSRILAGERLAPSIFDPR